MNNSPKRSPACSTSTRSTFDGPRLVIRRRITQNRRSSKQPPVARATDSEPQAPARGRLQIRRSLRSQPVARAPGSVRHLAKHPRARVALALLAALPFAGCGYSGGQFLAATGLFKPPTVPAKFKFGPGPVLVFVDDTQELCYWPEAKTLLAEAVTQKLTQQGAAKQVVPPGKVEQLRRSDRGFEERGCREIGEQLEAEQVLWLQIRAFWAAEHATDARVAARIGVSAKVINVLELQDRGKVRLWPASPSGQPIEADLSAAQLARAETRDAIARALADALAKKVVRNFYDRPMDNVDNQ